MFPCDGDYTQDVQQRFSAHMPESKVKYCNADDSNMLRNGSGFNATHNGSTQRRERDKHYIQHTACTRNIPGSYTSRLMMQ